MDAYLRHWRQDALNKGQHEAAIFIGDKLLALTGSDNDTFWLAQVYFSNKNYSRALVLLSKNDLIVRSSSCRYLAAHCYIKQNKYDEALAVLGESNPSHLINTNTRRKLQHATSSSHVALRDGKVRMSEDEKDKQDANNIKFEAAMCYLRGLCYARQNAFDKARDCYKAAVRINVQCFEAFDQLMKNSLMSPAEELEFLESLDFDSVDASMDPSIAQEAAAFTKLLYTTRLSKYASPDALTNATETLSTHYNLANNPDMLLSRAETLYTQCRFAEALQLTSSILNPPGSEMNIMTQGSQSQTLGHSPAVYPLHLACLYETGATNSLFLLAHTLADNVPDESYTYLAIGIYYMAVSKIAEARRFFSKASLLDPHSAPAWIGFAHTFAAEGEHDQAIAAYSTAARLFQGSHLPQLFLGMQHLALNNMSLAHEYLRSAYDKSCASTSSSISRDHTTPRGGDPLVLNELGIVLYHEGKLEEAVKLFRQALDLAEQLQCDRGAWLATRANLGHALRRLWRFDEALSEFDECLRIGASGSASGYSATIGGAAGGALISAGSTGAGRFEDRGLVGSLHTARGLVLLELGRTMEAVTALHEAVRVLGPSGSDTAAGAGVAATLLSKALEIWEIERVDYTTEMRKQPQGLNNPASFETPLSDARTTKGKGKGRSKTTRTTSKKVAREEDSPSDELNTAVEMALDREADDLLHRALAKSGRRTQTVPKRSQSRRVAR
ncbi:anaphase-promoting complex subunit cut9 [Ascosphaera apis ARSEF 7405]|uniref:Anaphase-promoting complex subunit cut9 n=1 Tax=Ascosphaera apis ARSEF 7405 TaxID=392613 RepID=A0A167X9J4_9EURO|nr:anaphase-promoting complex subunit cut9 [Ascosphaera apis ARSEF 7405]